MTTFKHNITSMLSTDGSNVWDIMSGVNVASEFMLAYTILFVIWIISSWLLIQKTSDIGKSMIQSSYITFLLSLILFYGGKVNGVDFIPNIVMFGLAVLLAVSLAAIKFMRFNKNENR